MVPGMSGDKTSLTIPPELEAEMTPVVRAFVVVLLKRIETLEAENRTLRDRVEKLDLYASSGVPEYWVVDPKERQIDFLVNQGGRFEVQLAREERYQSSNLNEVQINLAEIWQEVDARLP